MFGFGGPYITCLMIIHHKQSHVTHHKRIYIADMGRDTYVHSCFRWILLSHGPIKHNNTHGQVIICPAKYGMKLLIHSQTSMAQLLKFGNGLGISTHFLMDTITYPCWDYNGYNHLSMLGLKLKHVSKMGPRTFGHLGHNINIIQMVDSNLDLYTISL